MSEVRLDWAAAEVKDGKLEVPLDGELPSGWKKGFDRTVALLGGGDWGEVKVKKDRVLVAEVVEGDESRLHHFLESVALQANAPYQEEPEADEGEDAEDGEDADEGEEAEGPDAEMTERFRSFGSERDD